MPLAADDVTFEIFAWALTVAVLAVVLWLLAGVLSSVVWIVGKLVRSERLIEAPGLWLSAPFDLGDWVMRDREWGRRGYALLLAASGLTAAVVLAVVFTVWEGPTYLVVISAVAIPPAVFAVHLMEGDLLRRSSITVVPLSALAVAFVWGWIVFALLLLYLLVAVIVT